MRRILYTVLVPCSLWMSSICDGGCRGGGKTVSWRSEVTRTSLSPLFMQVWGWKEGLSPWKNPEGDSGEQDRFYCSGKFRAENTKTMVCFLWLDGEFRRFPLHLWTKPTITECQNPTVVVSQPQLCLIVSCYHSLSSSSQHLQTIISINPLRVYS